MDRRFVCESCGMKWFIPANLPHLPDLESCDGCGGCLVPLATAAGRAARPPSFSTQPAPDSHPACDGVRVPRSHRRWA